jgi:hypothetical protein
VILRAAALLALVAGCAPSVPVKEPTQREWDDALRRLAALRATFPSRPYTQPVTVDFEEPYTRRRFEGRGAVGVDPGHAMRMILVGPAGEPALDVWVTRAAWRMVVPAIHLVRRGGLDAPASMPIGFFRAWFIAPLGGHLLALGPDGELVVRDETGGTLHITDVSGSSGKIRRRSGTTTERFAFGEGRASYSNGSTKLSVEVKLGAVQADAPDPQAFVDPDASSSSSSSSNEAAP